MIKLNKDIHFTPILVYNYISEVIFSSPKFPHCHEYAFYF